MSDKERSQKVYQWSRQQLNMRVGAGKCWDFADRALRQAGARSSTTTGRDDNYDWGTPVKPVIPGDVLQFRNHTIKTTVTTKYPDQSTESIVEFVDRPHHTARHGLETELAESTAIENLIVGLRESFARGMEAVTQSSHQLEAQQARAQREQARRSARVALDAARAELAGVDAHAQRIAKARHRAR